MTKSTVVDVEGFQFHLTDRAILFWTDETDKRKAVWLPLSQIEIEDRGVAGLSGPVTVTLPQWLAEAKGLV